MAHEKPLPQPDADSKPFWDACREHKLIFQKCISCGEVRWPPSILCPKCLSQETRWIESAGIGTLHTYAVYHQAFSPAFKGDLPYVVAVVKLREGPMLLSNLVDCPHQSLACDMPVRVTWEDVSGECSLPKFRPL